MKLLKKNKDGTFQVEVSKTVTEVQTVDKAQLEERKDKLTKRHEETTRVVREIEEELHQITGALELINGQSS